jgi:hypothetical protein
LSCASIICRQVLRVVPDHLVLSGAQAHRSTPLLAVPNRAPLSMWTVKISMALTRLVQNILVLPAALTMLPLRIWQKNSTVCAGHLEAFTALISSQMKARPSSYSPVLALDPRRATLSWSPSRPAWKCRLPCHHLHLMCNTLLAACASLPTCTSCLRAPCFKPNAYLCSGRRL